MPLGQIAGGRRNEWTDRKTTPKLNEGVASFSNERDLMFLQILVPLTMTHELTTLSSCANPHHNSHPMR